MFKPELKRLYLYFITDSFWQTRAWSLQTDWSSCVRAKQRSYYFISQANCTALWQMLVEMSHGPWWDKSTLKHNLHIEQKLCLSKNCHYVFFPSMHMLCVGRLNKRSWILILTWAFASSMVQHQTLSLQGNSSLTTQENPSCSHTDKQHRWRVPWYCQRRHAPASPTCREINPTFPKRQPDTQWALPAEHCYKFIALSNTLTVNLIFYIFFIKWALFTDHRDAYHCLLNSC